MESEPGSLAFVLTRFLHANRYPLRLMGRKLEGTLLAVQNGPSQKPFLALPQDVVLVFGDGREQVADDAA
jgi:hypothetical protein